MNRNTVVAWAAAGSALAMLGLKVIRPWYLRWGAVDKEIVAAMPLDERIPDPNMISTRAITIDAPPERVWPWVAQMGDRPRAGYYSYAWIERLQGMSIENATRIMPECQTLSVGQAIDKNGTITVLHVDPPNDLVLGPPDSVEGLRCTWAFALRSDDGGKTRLITRVRARVSYRQMLRGAPPYAWPFLLLLDPGAFVMERKMLKEIKRRAESPDPRVLVSTNREATA